MLVAARLIALKSRKGEFLESIHSLLVRSEKCFSNRPSLTSDSRKACLRPTSKSQQAYLTRRFLAYRSCDSADAPGLELEAKPVETLSDTLLRGVELPCADGFGLGF